MYPDHTKLKGSFGCLSVDPPRGTGDGKLEITVALESYAGTGDVQVDLDTDSNHVEFGMSPDDALILADALTSYANASKRISANHPQRAEAEESPY
jgi:hypothetical protein